MQNPGRRVTAACMRPGTSTVAASLPGIRYLHIILSAAILALAVQMVNDLHYDPGIGHAADTFRIEVHALLAFSWHISYD